jgi:glutamyl-tRNA synthetase
MEITHVLRAQEWISSGQLHILLYRAFGWEPPKYCHLPMVLGQDGHKLSKRHGSTSVKEFIEKGYLKEALINYISLLGWAYDDTTEFFAVQELEKLFTINKLNKAPAVFDYKKLEWFNGMYIRKLSRSELAKRLLPFLQRQGIISEPATTQQKELLASAVPLVQERLNLLSDVSQMVGFLFKEVAVPKAEDLIPKKADKQKTREILEKTKELIADFNSRNDEENEAVFRKTAEELDIKLGTLLMPLRVAVTGTHVSPPLFESIKILGIEKTQARIDKALLLVKK